MATLVSPGRLQAARSESSNEISDTSVGTASPNSRQACSTPCAIRSFMHTKAVGRTPDRNSSDVA